MKIELDQLIGTWRHSHEEDTANESVYRHEDFFFPPSRGRIGYEFYFNHRCTYIAISPRDGAVKEESIWQLDKDVQNQIVLTFPNGQQRILQIVSLTHDRLIIKKP